MEGNGVYSGRSTEELWRMYHDGGRSTELRNYFIEKYRYLLKAGAESLCRRLPPEVDPDDMASVGFFGLIDAIEDFDLDRGVRFSTYAARRIRGAMLDELRAMDWVPRLVRHRSSKFEKAKADFRQKHSREPTREEIKAHLNLSDEGMERIEADTRVTGTFSQSRAAYHAGRDTSSKQITSGDLIDDQKTQGPDVDVASRDLRRAITRGMDSTTKLVIVLHEFEGYTMREVGSMLLLSESRVSQIHSAALLKIKSDPSLRALVWPDEDE